MLYSIQFVFDTHTTDQVTYKRVRYEDSLVEEDEWLDPDGDPVDPDTIGLPHPQFGECPILFPGLDNHWKIIGSDQSWLVRIQYESLALQAVKQMVQQLSPIDEDSAREMVLRAVGDEYLEKDYLHLTGEERREAKLDWESRKVGWIKTYSDSISLAKNVLTGRGVSLSLSVPKILIAAQNPQS